MTAPLRAYWCRSCGWGRNFGDQLGPRLLERYGIAYEWAVARDAELFSVGSVLSKIPDGWRGTVLGTGTIHRDMRVWLSRARVLALRGELSRRATGTRHGVTLGDPGILAADFLEVRPVPTSLEVIAPHYVDTAMAGRHPGLAHVDPAGDPVAFLQGLAGAALVYTSSLHALIAADALGVPHVLEPHASVIGGLHKFSDYVSAFGERIRVGVPRLTDRAAMAERQAEIRALYALLAAEHA